MVEWCQLPACLRKKNFGGKEIRRWDKYNICGTKSERGAKTRIPIPVQRRIKKEWNYRLGKMRNNWKNSSMLSSTYHFNPWRSNIYLIYVEFYKSIWNLFFSWCRVVAYSYYFHSFAYTSTGKLHCCGMKIPENLVTEYLKS